jgi:hypothetical protein
LTGDALIADPAGTLTHAITIHARPSDVWPWLIQMGAGNRAGWYSYDALDNRGHPSATNIVPELQHISIGTLFPALPGETSGFTVLSFVPERSLVLGWLNSEGGAVVTWTFFLEPWRRYATRLIVRARGSRAYRFRGLPISLSVPIVRIIHFVMVRKQLRSIAWRVESARQAALAGSPRPVLERGLI